MNFESDGEHPPLFSCQKIFRSLIAVISVQKLFSLFARATVFFFYSCTRAKQYRLMLLLVQLYFPLNAIYSCKTYSFAFSACLCKYIFAPISPLLAQKSIRLILFVIATSLLLARILF